MYRPIIALYGKVSSVKIPSDQPISGTCILQLVEIKAALSYPEIALNITSEGNIYSSRNNQSTSYCTFPGKTHVEPLPLKLQGTVKP